MRGFFFFLASFFLGAVAAATGAFWYVQSALTVPVAERTSAPVASSSALAATTSSATGALPPTTTATGSAAKTDHSPVPVSEIELTDEQRALAESLGIDTETFVIRPAMITCARERLGPERFEAIASGAQPGPLETARLVPCLSAE